MAKRSQTRSSQTLKRSQQQDREDRRQTVTQPWKGPERRRKTQAEEHDAEIQRRPEERRDDMENRDDSRGSKGHTDA